jgi:hypothetical protein
MKQQLSMFNKPNPSVVIHQILSGKTPSLNCFKSIEDKAELIKCAVDTHHSSTILNVVIYIKDTVSMQIFTQLLAKHEEAISVFSKYLKEKNNWTQLLTIYRYLGRSTDEGMTLLYAANKQKEVTLFSEHHSF